MSDQPSLPENPVARPGALTQCVYFSDREPVERIKKVLAKHYPRASLSSILSQVVGSLADELEKLPVHERKLKAEVTVWL